MVFQYNGIEKDEVKLTELCGTTIAGTGLAEIADAAEQLGFQSAWKTNATFSEISTSLKNGYPVMAMVDARFLHDIQSPFTLGHLVVIVGVTKDEVIYHDPAMGENLKVVNSVFNRAWKNMRKGMVIVW